MLSLGHGDFGAACPAIPTRQAARQRYPVAMDLPYAAH